MDFFKRRANARFICVAMIVISIWLGSGSSLRKLRVQAENLFYYDARGNEAGIQYDLERIMENAYNLTVVAGRYISSGDLPIANVLKARDELMHAQSPCRKYAAMSELVIQVQRLYDAMAELQLSDRDRDYRSECMINIISHSSIISNNGYNKAAAEFNDVLASFPNNFMRFVTFVKPLELFAQE